MIPGVTMICELPLCDLPAEYDVSTVDRFANLDPDDNDLTWLGIFAPFNPAAEVTIVGGPAPVAVLPIGVFDYTYQGDNVPIYLGSHQNFRSKAADVPARKLFDGILDPVYSLTARVGSTDDPMGGASFDVGAIGINAPDGSFDYLSNCVWGGSLVDILVGKYSGLGGAGDWALSEFALAFRGLAIDIPGDEQAQSLTITSRLSILNAFLYTPLYKGTGGLDGHAGLTGQAIPRVLGWKYQVPGVLLDGPKQIYQFSWTLNALSNLCNRGALIFAGPAVDYATYAELDAAAVAPGEYATCLAHGVVKLGSPATVLTADCEGPAAAGNFAGGISRYILRNLLGPGRNLGPEVIDATSFNLLDVGRHWETGLYINSKVTVISLLNQLMRDAGAALLCSRDDLIGCSRYDLPSRGPIELLDADIVTSGIRRLGSILPVRELSVAYAGNTLALADADIASSVTGELREDKKLAYRRVVQPRSPAGESRDAVIVTGLRYQADAAQLAVLAADLLSTMTHRYSVPLIGRALDHWLLNARRLVSDRFGQASGRDYIVVGVQESNRGGNSLELWGPPGLATIPA